MTKWPARHKEDAGMGMAVWRRLNNCQLCHTEWVITVPATASATSIDFDVPNDEFANNETEINLVANS